MNTKITRKGDGTLNVPDQVDIPFIVGDGIGPDIWRASVRVFDAAVEKAYGGTRQIRWKEVLAGEKAFQGTGEWLPEATLAAFEEYVVGIKGPLTTPVGGGIRSLNVAIRKALDLYVCLRPTRWFQGVPSPVKHPEDVDMVVFRENTEDIYTGIEFAADSAEGERLKAFLQRELNVDFEFTMDTALGIKTVSEAGSKRLVRAAIAYAVRNKKPTVTLVHKGNIMKYTEGAFKTWGYEVAEKEFANETFTWPQWERIKSADSEDAANAALATARATGKVIVNDVIADNFLQQIILNPKDYSVIATLNLNGDYLSDALAAIVGGIGIAPGANINYQTGHAVFEATHGTAPRFADTDTMNPSSVILSGAMLLDYIGWNEAARLIEQALQEVILQKTVTIDFYNKMTEGTLLKTSEFGSAIVDKINTIV